MANIDSREENNNFCAIQFDYFRGMEAEQYSFYRVPKVLFTAECFQTLSCEAKVLYGLMLDRMSLSIKNRWLDGEDRVYIIFTVDEVAELMNCGTQKAVKLMKELDEDRYRHTQGVMYTSAALAMRYGADLKKALLAGLLHDCAKCIPGHTKIKMCEKYNLEISEIERKNPSLLHAKLGAYLAKDKYDIEDEEILMAIRSHTTGRPGMSLLEKIVYIADYMEPGRKELPNMMDVRHLAFEDIDKCLYRILRDSLVYLKAQDMPIDQTTEETYQYYNELYSKH